MNLDDITKTTALNTILNLEKNNRFAEDFFNYFPNWKTATPTTVEIEAFVLHQKPMTGWRTKRNNLFKVTKTHIQQIRTLILFAKAIKNDLPD